MSTALATLVATALYALALLPLAWVAWKPLTGRWVAPVYGLALLAIAGLNVGWLQVHSVTPASEVQVPVLTDRDRCDQILDLLREARVVTGTSPSGELVVDQQAWDQIPPAVREVATACAEQRRAPGSEAASQNLVAPPGF
jgi:hypothetical protein